MTFFGLSDDLLSQKIRNIAAAARGAATRISSHDWKEEEVVVVEAVAAAVEEAVDEVAAGRLALFPLHTVDEAASIEGAVDEVAAGCFDLGWVPRWRRLYGLRHGGAFYPLINPEMG